jgi:hypothetical protein
MPTKDSTYNLQSKEETSRLANQHNVIKDKIGGLLAVPVDFTTKPLRVLNSATADGAWLPRNLSITSFALTDTDRATQEPRSRI